MINEYYYATIVECTKDKSIDDDATFEVVGDGIFKMDKSNSLEEKYISINDECDYSVLSDLTSVYAGGRYIDANAGIIPISKYLKYCRYTDMEKKEIYRLLRACDQKQRLESKLGNALKKFNSYRDTVEQIHDARKR